MEILEQVTITPDEATEKLRAAGMKICPATLRAGLQQQRFPFGDAVETQKSWAFWVYPALLKTWMEQRGMRYS